MSVLTTNFPDGRPSSHEPQSSYVIMYEHKALFEPSGQLVSVGVVCVRADSPGTERSVAGSGSAGLCCAGRCSRVSMELRFRHSLGGSQGLGTARAPRVQQSRGQALRRVGAQGAASARQPGLSLRRTWRLRGTRRGWGLFIRSWGGRRVGAVGATTCRRPGTIWGRAGAGILARDLRGPELLGPAFSSRHVPEAVATSRQLPGSDLSPVTSSTRRLATNARVPSKVTCRRTAPHGPHRIAERRSTVRGTGSNVPRVAG